MYHYLDLTQYGTVTRHIMHHLQNGGIQSFPDIESNQGPERKAYLAWVAEGNTAEEWSPNASE